MNLKTVFSNMGTSVKKNMKPDAFIKAVVSVPALAQQFPALATLSTSIAGILETYESIRNTLAKTNEKLTQASQALEKVQDSLNQGLTTYTKGLTVQGAYNAPSSGGPCTPGPTVTNGATTISTLVTECTNAKQLLDQTREQISKLETQLDEYYNTLTSKISEYVDSIINTEVV